MPASVGTQVFNLNSNFLFLMYATRLREPQEMGAFNFAFVVGVTRGASAGSDFTATTNDLDQAIDLLDLEEGDMVHEVVLLKKESAVGLTALNASVGVNGALTEFIGSTSMLAAGPKSKIGDDQAYAVGSGGKTLQINIDPGANGENVAALTAGEFVVLARITRWRDLITNNEF